MKSNYTISTGINKHNRAYILSEINYTDSFTKDRYELVGFIVNENLSFKIKRNGLFLGEVSHNYDNKDFLNNLNKIVKDYDFIEDFEKNHIESFMLETNSYVKRINSSVIIKGEIIDNLKDKLQRVAGINKK